MIERMVAGANADQLLLSKTQFVDFAFKVAIGDDEWVVQLHKGKVSANRRTETAVQPAFTIRADADAWEDFSRPVPPPGTHDILALFEGERLDLEGDMLVLFRNLMLVKNILGKARRTGDAR